jgi:predicted DNA-binding ribbon-helix-helix protein
MSGLEKRSLSLAGHRTSVALEAEFWAVLAADAALRAQSLAGLIAAVDEAREERSLASALRLHALAFLQQAPHMGAQNAPQQSAPRAERGEKSLQTDA